MEERIKSYCGGDISACSDKDILYALMKLCKDAAEENKCADTKKKLYYISAEFLIGKLLSNNLINLGIYDEVDEVLKKYGKSISAAEDSENEPSLGNGGLGRLASCFMDSVATLGLNGEGIGLCYHFGLFRQVFKNNYQTEVPDKWIEDNSWLIKTDICYDIPLGENTVTARMYDLQIVGANGQTKNLHLFDLESVSESLTNDKSIDFDKTDIKENLTLFLYPDDSDDEGRLLRVYQQYFMVSAAARYILDECIKKGCRLYDLPDYAVIQINDTHPSMIIPELIRLLMEKGLDADRAINAVTNSCAYTNHTILSEALEKWPIGYLKRAAWKTVPIIEMLDSRIRRKYNDNTVYIIDDNATVHMARMAIHFSFSTNGVASLHTEILKKSELKNFYTIYPERFNNKTNGITFRRWLIKSNPPLSDFIKELIGDGFEKNAEELRKLERFADDAEVLKKLTDIKSGAKKNLCDYLFKEESIPIFENSVFDIQIKRLHEYKRQQMNALYLTDKYLRIKSGEIPKTPITAIFGAKAAPAYKTAKNIIHFIKCLQSLTSEDKDVRDFLRVVMIENYNVTRAEKLIPSCDISEQISLASKEASGTGNMKLMLNGAVTLGTNDGANVEIRSLVGDDNIYIFGLSSDEVIEKYKCGNYNPSEYYRQDENIRRAVDFIDSDAMKKYGGTELTDLKRELLEKDYFMTLADLKEYTAVKDRAISDYSDRLSWARKMLINISRAGYFSSDRTVEEYNRDIWNLEC